MNEMKVVGLGLFVLGVSVVLYYFTDIIPKQIENREMDIIISLGIGLLILIVGKRQNHYLDEIIQTQHEMTQEIHKMIKEEMKLINEMNQDKNSWIVFATNFINVSNSSHILEQQCQTNIIHISIRFVKKIEVSL